MQHQKRTRHLRLSNGAGAALAHLRSQELPTTAQRGRALVDKWTHSKRKLTELDRALAAVPNRDAVAELVRLREGSRVTVESARARRDAIDAELARIRAEIGQGEAKLVSKIEAAVDADFVHEDALRVVSCAKDIRATLASFRERVLAEHVTRISELVMDSLRQLLRKGRLITGVSIDPKSLQETLTGPDGDEVSPTRLSAGERQLLAVSFLWGLARACNRPLPTVIDTPLGRLDSTHRAHLVERYFPHASHQVLLFSTDEEIDEQYHRRLKRWIGRSYLLDHDEASGTTEIRQGYFW